MINFSFNIKSPFTTVFRSLRSRMWSRGNWVTELQLVQSDTLIGATFDINTGDHAGVFLDFSIAGYTGIFQIYNTRHEDFLHE